MKTATETPATPDKTIQTMEKIQFKLGTIAKETARHKELAGELQKQEDELLKTVDLTNPEAFEQVSFLRRKRDIIPGRLKAFAEEREKLMTELSGECNVLLHEHRNAVDAKLAELTEKIAAAIKPFFGQQVEYINDAVRIVHERETGLLSAPCAANQIAGGSIVGRVLMVQKGWLHNGNLIDQPADRKARELISLVQKFEGLKA